MANPAPVSGLRPIRGAGGARICTLAGIAAAHDSLVELAHLKAGLELSIRDVEAQQRRDLRVSRAFMIVRWTKLTCDAFIGMAAVFSPGGKKVKAAYGVADVVTDSASKAATGQQVDYAKAAISAVQKGAGAMPGNTTDQQVAKFLVKTTAIKAEMVANAINAKPSEILKNAGQYAHELTKFTLEALGKAKAAKLTDLAKETFTYHQSIAAMFDDTLSIEEGIRMTAMGQRASLTAQARRIQNQIDRLQAFVADCELELARENEGRYGVSLK
jgi:hypothetical protein